MSEDASTDATTASSDDVADTSNEVVDNAAQQQANEANEADTAKNTGGADKTDWKAMARKHEQRAKDNAAAAKELAALKQSQMNDQQKAEAATADAIARAEKAERDLAVATAARKHGLTDDDLAILDGIPADRFDDAAKALAARVKKSAPPAKSGGEVSGDQGPKKPTTLESALNAHYQR